MIIFPKIVTVTFFMLFLVHSPALLFAKEPTPAFELGVNFLWDKGNTEKIESSFMRMQKMGIKTARTDLEWRAVEEIKGSYKWSKIDNLVEIAHKYNIELLPIVHYAPRWAVPAGITKPPGIYELALSENSYGEYSKFLNAAIDRYGPGGNAPVKFIPITNWQIWNEPNMKEFWYIKTGFLSPWDASEAAAKFVKFMRVVTDGLGSHRNKINVIHAGLSKPDTDYMWHLWNNDPSYAERFDVMAIHSYFFNPKGGVREVDAIDDSDDLAYSKMGFIGSKHDHGYLQKIFNVKNFLELKKSPKPIWVTEIGFMANKSGPTSKNPWVIKESKSLSITKQTLEYFTNHKQRLGVDRVYWFVLDDYNLPNYTGNFGIYRSNGSKRGNMPDIIDSYTP